MSTRTVTRKLAKSARNRGLALALRGSAVHCPVCDRSYARFAHRNRRPAAACPGCGAMERHRMFWLYVQRCTALLHAPHRVLHFAPEPRLERHLRSRPNIDYVTADLLRDDVDLRLDMSAIDLPDQSFDVVITSCVLEHVPDDRAAMRELLRVTRVGGWALLTAPVEDHREDTYEDWSVTTPQGRLEAFGQTDHVRRYGRNFPDLLRAEGWDVDPVPLPLSEEESVRFGIPPTEQRLYLGRRVA